jgi:hypothetical protein
LQTGTFEGETSPRPPDERWIRRLFFALVLLYVVPFWTVHYLPTVDGPCHTYDAWVSRSYADVPLFQKYYEINTLPYPNWISHGILALLMLVVPPLVAEKLLITLYPVLFLSGVWYLAGAVQAERRWLAFLAFPFVYNFAFQFGFYNFSIGLALFPWIVGFWWRRRERIDLRYAVAMNLLLWLCYFSHVVPFVLSLLAIAVLWLATLRRDNWRRHLRHIPALAPQLVLPLWFFAVKGAESVVPGRRTLPELAAYFLQLRILVVGEAQQGFAFALAVIFLGLAATTLWWGRSRLSLEANAFPLLALVLVAVYFFSPGGMGGGSLLKPRLSLFPYLVLIPWLTPPLARRARGLCVAGFALIALLNLGYMALLYQVMSRAMETYLAGLAPVRPNTRVLPLLFRRDSPVVGHAVSYAALEKNLIDWGNHAAASGLFPVRFRDLAPPPPYEEIERRPGSLSVEEWKDRADYVYTWWLPQGHPLVGRLAEHYNLISVVDGGALWERRE